MRVTFRVTSIRTMEPWTGHERTSARALPMLSIGRLGVAGGADYYLDKVANNVDDYYLGRGEAPGPVDRSDVRSSSGLPARSMPDALRNLLAGTSATGESLGLQLRPERRPGYDLTFSAPKGISLLWAFGPDQVRDAISDRPRSGGRRRARPALQRGLLTPAEDAGGHAAHRGQRLHRRGLPAPHQPGRRPPAPHPRGRPQPGPRGPTAGGPLPTAATCSPGRRPAGTLYQSALRAELAPLGLRWQVRRNGLSELADIPKAILRAFSKRQGRTSRQAMEQRGMTSAAAAAKAALATRERKPTVSIAGDVLARRLGRAARRHRTPRRRRWHCARPPSTI